MLTGERRNHALPLTGASSFLPTHNPISQATWIDLQRVAHGPEGERSGSPVVENPELSFPGLLPSAWMARFEVVLKTSHRIDKDTGHQAHDRLNWRRAWPIWVKLGGHNGIRAKRKIVACRTRRIDSRRIDLRTWVMHNSPTFRACQPRTKPRRWNLFLRRGRQKALLWPCRHFFAPQFRGLSPPLGQA